MYYLCGHFLIVRKDWVGNQVTKYLSEFVLYNTALSVCRPPCSGFTLWLGLHWLIYVQRIDRLYCGCGSVKKTAIPMLCSSLCIAVL